jgi:hypothetical protein
MFNKYDLQEWSRKFLFKFGLSKIKRDLLEQTFNSDFRFFVTIPLSNRNQLSDIDISSIIYRLRYMLNNEVFTTKELNRYKKRLYILPIIEKSNHIHLLINSPICKRFDELKEEEQDNKMKTIILKIITKMRLCHLKVCDPNDDFFKVLKTTEDNDKTFAYVVKEKEKLDNIDYTNVNLATYS